MQPQVLERSLPDARRPLRGRDGQLDQIAACLSARERRTLLLVAPLGSGKTRLLQEASAMAADGGFVVVDGPEVTALSLPVALAPHSNPSSWLTARLERHLVAQLRHGPVLVTVDNLHWTDPLTATALRDLMARLDDRPVVWIFAMRAEYLDSPNGLLLGEMAAADPRTEWLAPLDPLPDDVVAEVVADLLDATPKAALLSLCECMGGNARAIVDLVRGLVEDEASLVTTGGLLSLPQRFLASVRVRLGRLDPATQQAVQVAAVLGRRFAPADLAAMLAAPPAKLLKPLQEAMDAGFLECLVDSFQFRREPVWRAVLDTVPLPMLSLLGRSSSPTGWDGVSLTARADSMWRAGRVEDALATVRKAATQDSPWHFDPQWTLAWMQIRLRRLPDAADTLKSIEDSLAATKVLASIPSALRSWLAFASGSIAEAEAEALAGIGLVAATQMPLYEPHLRSVLALCSLRRGDVATASERLQFFDPLPSSSLRTWVTAQVAAARGPEAALAVLSEVRTDGARRRELLLEDPAAAAWCVRTALAAGDEIFARLFVATATDLGLGSHARALYHRDRVALASVQYSDRWAQASATEDLGSLLCSQDRDAAVSAFDRAMQCYDSLGSSWDSARVRSRLRRLGIRRRHWHCAPRPATGWASLTGTEEKVARLVAHGHTNRQVAAELFVSPHTVGFHLRQIYRKLAIQSRVDLARIAP